MNKWIVIAAVLILAVVATGFYLTKNGNDLTLYPPANLGDESSDSQPIPTNKNQVISPDANDTTSTQAPVTQKKVEPQKSTPSAIPRPPDLP